MYGSSIGPLVRMLLIVSVRRVPGQKCGKYDCYPERWIVERQSEEAEESQGEGE